MKQTLDFLKRSKNNNRLSHLYLVDGPVGSGKTNLAYEYANMLLSDYDNHLNLMELITDHKHSQVYFVEPDGLSIKKEQIIALQKEFTKTSLVTGPRLYIIKDVDLISKSAANSLLKFMEEPEGSNVYGILLTSNLANIIPTIISRSQVLRVRGISSNEIREKLIENGISEQLAFNLSLITNNYDTALVMASEEDKLLTINFLEGLLDRWQALEQSFYLYFIESLTYIQNDRKIYKQLLELMLIYFTDIIKIKNKQEVRLKYLEDKFKRISNKLSSEKLYNITMMIQEEITKQTYYINVGLSIEAFALRLEKSR